jgi:DNA-binding IscR family transcriptional regulator
MLARVPRKVTLLDIYRASGAPPAFGIHSYGRGAQVSVSRGVKPCLSDLLSQAQDSFEKALAKAALADLVSETRHNER